MANIVPVSHSLPTATSIAELLAGMAAAQPDTPALLAPEREALTYRGAWEQVQRTLLTLNQMGIVPGDRVAVVLPNGPEMAMTFLAIAAGATCAPLNPLYRAEEFAFYLTDLHAKAIILPAGEDTPAREVAHNLGIVTTELQPAKTAGVFDLCGNATADIVAPVFSEPAEVALILHTSGTTSRPKIVPLTQAKLCISARQIAHSLALTTVDRCLNIMPLFHVHGLVGALLSSLIAGGSIVCTPGFAAPHFFSWVDTYRPTWYTAVPTMHQAILSRATQHHEVIGRTPFRFIRSCSSALPPSVLAALENAFHVPVLEAYGMTEASHQIACNPLPPHPHKPGSVGLPTGTEAAIMDDTRRLLAQNEIGEVVIRGAAVTDGYEQNPDANAAAFTSGWFRTGDQGYQDADGYLFLTGRLKELINRGGEKIAPREIDEILLAHADVVQALTFALPHPQFGETVAAAVVLRADAQVTERGLQDYVAAHVADFKVPVRLVFLDELPKGATGKPQRIGLAARLGLTNYSPEAAPPSAPVAPRTEVEATLAAIWAEVLGLPEVGIIDNFFAIGGDSLLAAQIVARLRPRLTSEFPLHRFLDTPTIAAQAELLSEELLPENALSEVDELATTLAQLSDEEIQELLAD